MNAPAHDSSKNDHLHQVEDNLWKHSTLPQKIEFQNIHISTSSDEWPNGELPQT